MIAPVEFKEQGIAVTIYPRPHGKIRIEFRDEGVTEPRDREAFEVVLAARVEAARRAFAGLSPRSGSKPVAPEADGMLRGAAAIAAHFGVTPSAALHWIAAGLPAEKDATGSFVIERSLAERWVSARRVDGPGKRKGLHLTGALA